MLALANESTSQQLQNTALLRLRDRQAGQAHSLFFVTFRSVRHHEFIVVNYHRDRDYEVQPNIDDYEDSYLTPNP